MSEKLSSVFIHPQATCESESVGEGTRIWANAHVLSGAEVGQSCNLGEGVFVEGEARVGNHCTIKNGVSVWDFVQLEDGVFVGPNAVFTNDMTPRAFLKRGKEFQIATRIRQGATVGANATIVCGVEVGPYAMVAAGAVVTKNVPSHALVMGVPAQVVGKVCYCGVRLDDREFCSSCELALSENSQQRSIEIFQSKKRT